jgi:hypothetical protein
MKWSWQNNEMGLAKVMKQSLMKRAWQSYEMVLAKL